jgi:hypothetical protein
MLVQQFKIASTVALRVPDLPTDITDRLAFPRHLDRRQAPARMTGNALQPCLLTGEDFDVRSRWQAPQVLPGTPPPSAPRTTGGECGCMSSPCVGRLLAGWQFMQRGFMITFPASVNSMRERARGSAMLAKAEGGRSSIRFCACAAQCQSTVPPRHATNEITARCIRARFRITLLRSTWSAVRSSVRDTEWPLVRLACLRLDSRKSSLYNGRAPPSSAVRRRGAQVAQLVEHCTENAGVGGSIPPLGTTIFSFAMVFTDLGRSPPISSLAECGTAISA